MPAFFNLNPHSTSSHPYKAESSRNGNLFAIAAGMLMWLAYVNRC